MDPTAIVYIYRKFIEELVVLASSQNAKQSISEQLIKAIEDDDVDMDQVADMLTHEKFDDFSLKSKELKAMSKDLM